MNRHSLVQLACLILCTACCLRDVTASSKQRRYAATTPFDESHVQHEKKANDASFRARWCRRRQNKAHESHRQSPTELAIIEKTRGGSRISRRSGSYSTRPAQLSSLSQSYPTRKACNLYLWNAPSALLYVWCKRLQRDCVYEGRGGKKFVRVVPGSMLQLLFPCSQYSPDKCLLCGGTFHDHLLLRWSKHLYSPLDRYFDKEYQLHVSHGADEAHNKPLSNRVRNKQTTRESQPEFAFHRRYVVDTLRLLRGLYSGRTDSPTTAQSQRFLQRHLVQVHPNVTKEHFEYRAFGPKSKSSQPPSTTQAAANSTTATRSFEVSSTSTIVYAFPAVTAHQQFLRQARPTTIVAWVAVREIFLSAVEKVMDLEQVDRQRSRDDNAL